MDELVQHCVRELSFDGDFGCDVSRLRDFIVEFYRDHSSAAPQEVDEAFHAFVWSLVVQQPNVRVGLVPPGASSEVYIASQTSAKRKAKASGLESIEPKPAPSLEILQNAKTRPLHELKHDYGDNLRIAVDPEKSFEAITGSHVRSSKMSPMVYTALQLITRSREQGLSVVDLGQKSRYDQKTCFYLIKQLLELDLVVKVRRGGVGSHFCILKFFYNRSLEWRKIRDEATKAEVIQTKSLNLPEEQEETTIANKAQSATVEFEPIDARHLSSLPLVRARVIKLLKASRNYIHPVNNMIVTIGFQNPTKSDRRFFQSRIRELIQQGVIEKVIVPNSKKTAQASSVKCFRLLASDTPAEEADPVVKAPDRQDDDKDDEFEIDGPGEVYANLTIHQQIIKLLADAGTRGMTLSQISVALNHFDKRTLELLLARAEKFPPPSHLADLGIVGLMETYGRERRHRYYTVASYKALVSQEKLDDSAAGLADVNVTEVGGFCPIDTGLLYNTEQALFEYQDKYKDDERAQAGGVVRKYKLKNPVLPDGSVKQGRPRKHPEIPEKSKSSAKSDASVGDKRIAQKRKRIAVDDGASAAHADSPTKGPFPKKRKTQGEGKRVVEPEGDDPENVVSENVASAAFPSHFSNIVAPIEEAPESALLSEEQGGNTNRPKKRGRPAKKDKITSKAISSEVVDVAAANMVSKGPPVRQKNIKGKLGPGASIVESSDQQPPPEQEPALEERSTKRPRVDRDSFPLHANTEKLPAHPDTTPSATIETPSAQAEPPSPARSQLLYQNRDEVQIDPQLLSYGVNAASNARITNLNESEVLQPSQRPFESIAVDIFSKEVQPQSPAANTSKSSSRVNVSHLRRENELLRVIENAGGIVSANTKEFFDLHTALIESMTLAGEPTSAPVNTRIDKRTATMTLDNLEDRGRVKILKTFAMTPTGVSRPICIAYLPHIQQDKINTFLTDIGHSYTSTQPQPVKMINETLEYGYDSTPASTRASLPLQLLQMEQPGEDNKERWSRNSARANQLFSYDDSTIRAVLLTERTTLGQLYGFIVAKAMRVRKLHLTALAAFEEGVQSSHIVSIDHRVVHISYFCLDLPASVYCSLIAAITYDDELTKFLETDVGRDTLVRDLPPGLHSALQIGRSRARSRFMDILETLLSQKLVTPLVPSESNSPFITCSMNGEHPTAFDQASLEGWSATAPMSAPVYWRFNTSAAVYFWAISETSPPYWKELAVKSTDDAEFYWQQLHYVCTTNDTPEQTPLTDLHDLHANVTVARSLRRSSSWNPEYKFTWHQIQYLRRYVDITTGDTPLEKNPSEIVQISSIISAPQDTVRNFFTQARAKVLHDLTKARRKPGQSAKKKANLDKAVLSRKAAERKAQRETDWEALLQKMCSYGTLSGATAIRVERVRKRFLQSSSTKDSQKWELEIADALKETTAPVSKHLLKKNRPSFGKQPPPPNAPPPVVQNTPEVSIEELISSQGPPLLPRQPSKKRQSRKAKEENHPEAETSTPTQSSTPRRHRFLWNRDYDELVRDASAIIRARCRHSARIDWAAFEQVFPAVPRNSVRQRLAHIRSSPASEAYLTRLEDRWYELWTQNRGNALLPDDHPESSCDFELIKHIAFLRKHIDKNALRVGFAEAQQKSRTNLPMSVDQIAHQWDVLESESLAPPWDFMWNAVVEENREKSLQRLAFTTGNATRSTEFHASDDVLLAECALKMTLGTPNEKYDPDVASRMLHAMGQTRVSAATTSLLSRGVLSKSVRDPQKPKPGRTLKISELNQNALGGSIAHDTFQDAAALEEEFNQKDDWIEWPLLATDGDAATLIQIVSDHKAKFRIDTTSIQGARSLIDWNSKKTDDDQIEPSISVQFHDLPVDDEQFPEEDITTPMPQTESETDMDAQHGKTIENDLACCRRLCDGPTNCVACLGLETVVFLEGLPPQERQDSECILKMVCEAGPEGLPKRQVAARMTGSSKQTAIQMAELMANSTLPLLFWAGYTRIVLVSSLYLQNWTVMISDNPLTRIFPRRWLDITGCRIDSVWDSALKALIGVLLFRPGITQSELRWRLRSVYDRQEIHQILQCLLENGFVKSQSVKLIAPGPLDDEEERVTFWFVTDSKAWYRV